jgi:hypothetical protein
MGWRESEARDDKMERERRWEKGEGGRRRARKESWKSEKRVRGREREHKDVESQREIEHHTT